MNRPKGVIALPQQKRSRDSLKRLMQASYELIETDNFESVAVSELVQRANCSIGAFYGRFKNKEALFQVLQADFLSGKKNWVQREISHFMETFRKKRRRPSLEEVLDFILQMSIDMYSSSPGVFRALFLHSRLNRDADLLKSIRAFNRECADAAGPLFVALFKDEQNPGNEFFNRCATGLEIVLVYLREAIIFGEITPGLASRRLEETSREARNMLKAYIAPALQGEFR